MSTSKFKDKTLDKKEFYSSNHIIFLDDVDLSKIIVSSKCKINNETINYYCGYLHNDIIKPLCIIMPQMIGYIKYFDEGGKNMSFVSTNNAVYKKYSEIWNTIKKLLKVKFNADPIRDDKYISVKLKIYNGNNKTTFTDDLIPLENTSYNCIAAIGINSVIKIDKKVYPQAYLEQCKYKLKKRKQVNIIDTDIIDNDNDSDSDSDTDNDDDKPINLIH